MIIQNVFPYHYHHHIIKVTSLYRETTPLFPTWPASVALLALRGYCQENTATDSSTLYIQMKIRLHYNSRNPKTRGRRQKQSHAAPHVAQGTQHCTRTVAEFLPGGENRPRSLWHQHVRNHHG
ncbi:uncharacterized protein LOC123519219 [Portunus trituberculatus]|uniref:uncharacterized protein LOC123519219 n=1 Tax=Portunus trituberculatus TaxID=210409 RepID=UPI001E1CF2B4|nr:uncharacterized protein LOC123519219 [Portunus trituberculatus]